jgi:hypothetical protein
VVEEPVAEPVAAEEAEEEHVAAYPAPVAAEPVAAAKILDSEYREIVSDESYLVQLVCSHLLLFLKL